MKTATKRCRKRYESERLSRKKKEDCFALLPDDLIIDILQKLPSDILRYKTKFVCKRWFNLITNKILLDHASLILETPDGCHKVRLMDIREENEGLKMKDQYLDIPYNGRIKAWCNEFLLITDLNREGYLYIFNLITKEGSFLPICPIMCGGHYAGKCGLGLSYDEFKGVYKVVHVFMGPPIQCELLIFKSNIISSRSPKWKKIDGPSYTGQRKYYWDDPVSVQGRYFHWDVHCCKYLVSMDTVKEEFRQTCLPVPDLFPANNRYSFVEMGGFLTLLYKVSPEIINIWMLKDFQKTKWEKLHSIAVTSSVRSSVYPGSGLPLPITSLDLKVILLISNIILLMGGSLTLFHKVCYETINIWMLKDFQRTKWVKLHSVCAPSDVSSIVYPDRVLPEWVTSLKSKRYLISRKPGETGLYGYDLEGYYMEKLDFDIAPDERCVVHSWSFL